MGVYRFAIADPMNPWVVAIEVEADNPAEASRRAGSYLFARRTCGDHETLVHLTEEPHGG